MATRSLRNLLKYKHSLAFICKDLWRTDVSLFHQWDAKESSYGLPADKSTVKTYTQMGSKHKM
jgi:hypothetical protein